MCLPQMHLHAVLSELFVWSFVVAMAIASLGSSARSEEIVINYDESKVKMGELPPIVESPITDLAGWNKRRIGLKNLIEELQFGTTPHDKQLEALKTTIESRHLTVMHDGSTECIQYRIHLANGLSRVPIDVALFLPKSDAAHPAKVKGCFVGLNFEGNHSISDHSEILLCESWLPANLPGVVDHCATNKSRNTASRSLPVREITAAGYAVATAYYGDIDPDFDDGFRNGVHSLFEHRDRLDENGKPADDINGHSQSPTWGSIAAWSWGLSRIADSLLSHPSLGDVPLFVYGHSRLGKAALWAGGCDERFKLVIANNSGCGGTAIERRDFGETIERITTSFPHWFAKEYLAFRREGVYKMPFDAHMLIAINAPRSVYITSAVEDAWADPRGEFLGGWYASSIYRTLGLDGLPDADKPLESIQPDRRIGTVVSYHMRSGKHDLTAFDWKLFIERAEEMLR